MKAFWDSLILSGSTAKIQLQVFILEQGPQIVVPRIEVLMSLGNL